MIRKGISIALFAAAALGWSSTIDYVGDAGRLVADNALTYLGVPYRLAGTDASGVDCSGLVYTVYAAVTGARLPRTVQGLMERGDPVQGRVQAGDLLFFDTTGGPSHVGIALDSARFVHAASEGPSTGVIVSTIDERYYRDRFLGARRLLTAAAPGAAGAGRFVVHVDEAPVRARLSAPLAPGAQLAFALSGATNREGGASEFLTLRALLDGIEVMARRVRVAPGAEAGIWMVASPGHWTVIVEGGGGGFAELQFEAGGRP